MPAPPAIEPHVAPPHATLRQKLGPGGLSSLLLAFLTALLGLGIPVVVRLRTVLAAAKRDERRVSDVIVVLGRLLEENRPSAVFRARLGHAAQLWREGLGRRVLVTGGVTGGASRSEAEAGREVLLALGVPAEVVWTEEHSQHTVENLFYVRQRLRQLGLTTLLLVSDPLHLARAAATARGLGLDVACSPATSSPPRRGSFGWWYRAWRESFFLHWYHTGMAWSRLIRAERQLARVT